MSVKILIVLITLIASTYLFHKASGSLAITKLNIVSYIYYLFLVTTLIGGSLIYIGFQKHYMIKSMMLNESTIDKTFMFIMYTALVLPTLIIIVQKIFRIKANEDYAKMLKRETVVEYEGEAFLLLSIAAMICILVTILMFVKMGRVPLLDLIINRGIDVGKIRRIVTTTNYINPYVKNLIVLTLTPLLSYFSFIYWQSTNERKWMMIFSMLFATSILIKTYDYSKSPVVFYLFIFVLIYIMLKGKISMKWLMPAGGLLVFIIVFMYSRSGYDMSKGIDIYNGPIGRTIFTSVATLFLHFDLFPKHLPFLSGRSLAPTVLSIIGLNYGHVRSGRVVMEFYSPYRVYEGTAGVMNSMFVGEAYGNFGVIGAILAPIYIGLLLGVVFTFIIKARKTPQNLMLYTVLIVFFSTALNGGFTDFVYNFNMIFIIAGLICFNLMLKLLNKFSKIKI